MEAKLLKNWQMIIEKSVMRRKQLNLSQMQLAQLSGISQSTISRIEQSELNVELEHVMKLFYQLGIELNVKIEAA